MTGDKIVMLRHASSDSESSCYIHGINLLENLWYIYTFMWVARAFNGNLYLMIITIIIIIMYIFYYFYLLHTVI